MKPFYDDERISGYLDGELTAEEQASFEEELAQNAELRQVVDELRSLRSDLDLLPRSHLESDFAARVLRRAEREMLSGGKEAPAAAEPPPTSELTPAPAARDMISSRWSRERLRRPLLWSAATIAAAILIMAFTRDHDQGKRDQVAQVGGQEAAHGPFPPGHLTAPADQLVKDGEFNGAGGGNGDRQLEIKNRQFDAVRDATLAGGKPPADSDARRSAQKRTPEQQAAQDLKSLASEDRPSEKMRVVGELSVDKEKEMSAPASVAAKPAAPKSGSLFDNRANGNDDTDHTNFRREIAKGAAAANGSPAGEGNNAQPAAGALADDAKLFKTPALPAPPATSAPSSPSPPLTKSELAASEAKKSTDPAANSELNFSERFARRTFGLGMNREESARTVVVAQCVATPDATNGRFQKILRQRGLQWREGPVAEGVDETKQFSPAPLQPMVEEEKSDSPAKTSEKYADASGGRAKSAAGRGEDGATKSGQQRTLGRQQDVAIFYVEASPEQIQAVIDDLQSQPHVYQKLTVSAAGSEPLHRGVAHDGAAADAEMDNFKVGAGEARSGGEFPQGGRPAADQPAAPLAASQALAGSKTADKGVLRKQDEAPADSATRGLVAPKLGGVGGVAATAGHMPSAPEATASKAAAPAAEPPVSSPARIVTNQQPTAEPPVGGADAPVPVNGPPAIKAFGSGAGDAKKPAEQAPARNKLAPTGGLAGKRARPDGEMSDKPAAGAAAPLALQQQSDRAKDSAAKSALGGKAPPPRMQAVFVFRFAPASEAASEAPVAAPAPSSPPATTPAAKR